MINTQTEKKKPLQYAFNYLKTHGYDCRYGYDRKGIKLYIISRKNKKTYVTLAMNYAVPKEGKGMGYAKSLDKEIMDRSEDICKVVGTDDYYITLYSKEDNKMWICTERKYMETWKIDYRGTEYARRFGFEKRPAYDFVPFNYLGLHDIEQSGTVSKSKNENFWEFHFNKYIQNNPISFTGDRNLPFIEGYKPDFIINGYKACIEVGKHSQQEIIRRKELCKKSGWDLYVINHNKEEYEHKKVKILEIIKDIAKLYDLKLSQAYYEDYKKLNYFIDLEEDE